MNSNIGPVIVAVCFALLMALTACGGGSPKSEPQVPAVGVSVSPASVTVGTAQTQSFTASVTNSTNTAVTWSVQEGAAGGAITSAGVYTAPTTAGTYHVVATSQADASKSATATVTVKAVAVSISPTAPTVIGGQAQTFTATVTNATNTAVTWSIQEGAAGGSITNAGVYTAPLTAGTYHVVATSQADATKSATATITVPAVAVAISPTTATLTINGTQTFTATVTNAPGNNTAVTWSVQEGETGGAVTNAGVFTAPVTPGTYHVVATSQADVTKSAKATVTVTAPPPVFSSTPVTDANEGDPYTYTVQASDPLNSSVNYALTTAPGGATIEAGVISWTPTKEQSRTSNSFTVTATTSLGGSATQSWTVTPTGTIRGTRVVTFYTENGPVQEPQDLSWSWIYAYVPDGDGGYTEIDGTGTETGEFTIEKVPAGSYWLVLDWDTFWTRSSTVDLGYDLVGRPDYAWPSDGTSMLLQMTNLSPWQANDEYEPFTPNVDSASSWYFPDPSSILGYTSINADTPWTEYPLLDASKKDKTYLTQLIGTPVGSDVLRYAGKYSGPLDVTLTDGASTSVPAPLADVSLTDTFHMNIKGSAFEQLLPSINPAAVTKSSGLQLDVHPFGLDHGVIGSTGNLLTYWPSAPIKTDQNLGDFPYGNPYPAEFGKVLRYWQSVDVPVKAPGATNPTNFEVDFYQETTDMPSAGNPIQPAISPVTSATINGVNFFAAQTISTPEVTISWQAPAVGTATGYRVRVYELYAEGTDSYTSEWSTFYTKETSIVLPGDTFEPGYSFIVRITADSEPNVDFETAPYRVTAPYAHAESVSGVLTFDGTPIFLGKSGAARSKALRSHKSGLKLQSGTSSLVNRKQWRTRTLGKPAAAPAKPATHL